jgi:hypothetical protein
VPLPASVKTSKDAPNLPPESDVTEPEVAKMADSPHGANFMNLNFSLKLSRRIVTLRLRRKYPKPPKTIYQHKLTKNMYLVALRCNLSNNFFVHSFVSKLSKVFRKIIFSKREVDG